MATALRLRRCPRIACHHCGQDYARAYLHSDGKGDPYCCDSCRRDTNPDAADAPRWTPERSEADDVRAMQVSPARKQCRTCKAEWDGLIFGPAPQGLPLPFGICPDCGAKEDAALAAMTTRIVPLGMPLPELARPQRVTEADA